MTRSVLLLAHAGRARTTDAARAVAARLVAAGVEVRLLEGEAEEIAAPGTVTCAADDAAASGVELVLVLGGDGTILRAAELARDAHVPLLGVNLGRVGFLAEVESSHLDTTVDHVLAREYDVEERLTVDLTATLEGRLLGRGWALNEVCIEKGDRARVLDLVVEVDGRPLSRWGCDGVLAATPTGSTAYAFSAGGPIVWPGVEALLLVPISAHALFARPMVVAPSSVVAMEVLPSGTHAVLSCDGRRSLDLPHGARVEVRRGEAPVLLAKPPHPRTFTDTLVEKFDLPVDGWRGREP
ncbi:MAG TPA: NAD kinase [Mycobacteriales bacterium]|nr:NAD kinase [Mycobacteriales bacterium]